MTTSETKYCSGCDTTKSITDFYHQNGKPKCYCKPCSNKKSWEYIQATGTSSIRNRAASLKRRYGITLEEYQVRHDAQAGRCALCRTEDNRLNGEHMAVDHDHDDGRIRGLLCGRCNRALGMLGDTPKALTRSLAYCLGVPLEIIHEDGFDFHALITIWQSMEAIRGSEPSVN